MKFSYKFSNILGATYQKGNILFTPDGNSVISPVGNRIIVYNLKENKSKALSVESRYNYTGIALSPKGNILLAGNETGEVQLISILTCTVIHRHKFHTAVNNISFSPDGKYFAVTNSNRVLIYKTPGELSGEYNPFVLERNYTATHDDIVSIDWSSDSRFLVAGSLDNSIKILAVKYMEKFRPYLLGGHTDSIVGCFFERNSLDVNTLSKNGQLFAWECSLELSDLVEGDNDYKEVEKKKSRNEESSSESENANMDEFESIEKINGETEEGAVNQLEKVEDKKLLHPFYFKRLGKYYLCDEARKENKDAIVTSAAYHSKSKILVVAFSTGAFYLYELPDVNIIHSLSISDCAIGSTCFNCSGDWIALAVSGLGQLLVWEWQSEQYIMKQQGHVNEINCISYSPDGQCIVSGGEDAKVKVWNINSGFCFVTFSEHTSAVTDIHFSSNKKFFVSSSLDGTVRAYDVVRYRNFRTFTSPQLVQFSCVAIDSSGELVAAGGQDVFEIYLWSIKLGKLLEVLSGHEAPVASIVFSPIVSSSTLISGSWDKTLRIWNCIEKSGDHETIDVLSDVTCVAFKPNGEEVAVATLNGNISFFELKTAQQITSIEGRKDLDSGVSNNDVITAKKNLEGKCFTSIVYSADGECLLAAGKSYNVCIYNIKEGILLKKFEITQNHSLEGMNSFIDRRKITEFGNMALIEERESLEGGRVAIRLPGVKRGDVALRCVKPEIKVHTIKFSPTGLSWAAASTEGLLIYSLDKGIVFDPFNLSLEVTPKAARDYLKKKEYTSALLMALKLNENLLIQEIIEAVPYGEINLICSSLPNQYILKVLQSIVGFLESTTHIEFYLNWIINLLNCSGNNDNTFNHQVLLSVQESLSRKYERLSKICNMNKFTLKTLLSLPPLENNVTENSANDIDEEEIFSSILCKE